VQHIETGAYAVAPGTNPTAEINATGKVVYGYNLRVVEAGDYYITFNVPGVDLSLGCNHTGDADETCAGQETKIRITVGSGGGGGGGGGNGGGGQGPKDLKKPHPIHPFTPKGKAK
jgi:hypothetical protein